MNDYRDSIKRRAEILDVNLTYEQLAVLNQRANDDVSSGTDPLDALDVIYEHLKNYKGKFIPPVIDTKARDIRIALGLDFERAERIGIELGKSYAKSSKNGVLDGATAINDVLPLAEQESELIYIGWGAASIYLMSKNQKHFYL